MKNEKDEDKHISLSCISAIDFMFDVTEANHIYWRINFYKSKTDERSHCGIKKQVIIALNEKWCTYLKSMIQFQYVLRIVFLQHNSLVLT